MRKEEITIKEQIGRILPGQVQITQKKNEIVIRGKCYFRGKKNSLFKLLDKAELVKILNDITNLNSETIMSKWGIAPRYSTNFIEGDIIKATENLSYDFTIKGEKDTNGWMCIIVLKKENNICAYIQCLLETFSFI